MSAYNPQCFNKGCICATCEYICSRCLVSDNTCAIGKRDCDRYIRAESIPEEIVNNQNLYIK